MCGWCGTRLNDGGVQDHPPVQPIASVVHIDALQEGTVLADRFVIDTMLGRGGFGITYRAWDNRLERHIAIKELFPLVARRDGVRVVVENGEFAPARTRFQREASLLARFSVPGIVRVFEVIEANNTVYMAMELINGQSMSEVFAQRGHPLDVDEVLEMVIRVGTALTAVHEAGLLHRDVNPSNIMLANAHRYVLIDFGLARRFGDQISNSMTRAVTPGYAPPEQYAGSISSGPSCDVFGLAATAYKLLTGVTPTNVFDRQAGVLLEAPSRLNPAIPSLVSAGILDGMELDADHRPASTQAFIDRLGLHAASNPAAHVASWPRSPEGPALQSQTQWPPVAQRREPDATRQNGEPPPADRGPDATIAAPVPVQMGTPPTSTPSVPPQVAPLRNSGFASWHDGSPPVVGPPERWRGWVTWPAAIVCVALSSVAPVVLTGVLTLVILPMVATWGDVVVHSHRQRTGAQRRRWHAWSVNAIMPVRIVRNVCVALLRAVPSIGVVAIGFVAQRSLSDSNSVQLWTNMVVRVTGTCAALLLLIPARGGGRTFRSDLGITEWARWLMEGKRRPGVRAGVIWVFAVASVAISALLAPDFWPLH